MDAKQQEVLMPTPSRVVTVEVLINDQALSTQDPQGAITHSAICPLLGLLLLHQLHLNARWPSSLPVQVLPSSNAHALLKGYINLFHDGAIPSLAPKA